MKTLRPHLFWDILRRSLEEDRMLFFRGDEFQLSFSNFVTENLIIYCGFQARLFKTL